MAESLARPRTLDGWKAIASYFGRDERTVMRWAAQRGMPIHRIPGSARAPIYALPEELSAWFAGGGNADTAAPAGPAPAPRATRRQSMLRRRAGAAVVASALLAGGAGAWFASGARLASNLRAPHLSRDGVAELSYLQARYDLSTRTAAGLQRAVREFGKAIGRDPAFADAQAGLAEAYLLLREYGDVHDAEAYPRAQAAAQAAVRIDPNLAPAHRALGFVAFWWNGDVATARREFGRALALEPDNAETHHWLATALSANGEQDAALDEILRARRLDPQSTAILADFGFIAYVSGNAPQGTAILREVVASAPEQASPHHYLAEFALMAKDGATHLREAEACARLRGDTAGLAELVAARAAFARGGVDALLRARLEAVARGPNARNAYGAAGLAALLGDRERALALLAEARADHDPGIIAFPGDLRFATVRGDPRFASYLRHDSLKT